MKKILVLFAVALGTFFVVSCTNDENDNQQKTNMSFEKTSAPKTMRQLRELNDSLVKSSAMMRSGWVDRCKVAHADYKWGKRGFKAGQLVAGLAGIYTGGIGYFAVVGVSTVASGGLASYLKKKEIDGDYMTTEELVNSLSAIENLFEEHSTLDSIGALGADIYLTYAMQIQLPSDFEHVRRWGNDHNAILAELRTLDTGGGMRSHYHEYIDDPINTTNPNVEMVFSSRQFSAATNDAFDYITATSDGDAQCSSGSENVDEIYEMFLSIMDTYFTSPTDLISAINSYISIIENNNELTYEEKEIVYGGFLIAFYSVQYWNED